MNYSIRITRSYTELESWVNGLDDIPFIVVYEHHDGARIHCHMLLKECPVKTTTLKARIVKAIGNVAKTDWSFITTYQGNPVDDKVITYFSKGILEPSFVKGFTRETIDILKGQWVVKATNPRGPSKSNKITYNDIVKLIIEEFETLPPTEHFQLLRQRVPRVVLRYLRKYEIVCGRYKARDLVDTVLIRMENRDFTESFESMCSFLTK